MKKLLKNLFKHKHNYIADREPIWVAIANKNKWVEVSYHCRCGASKKKHHFIGSLKV